MEWDLKTSSWDFAELERDAEPSIGSVVNLTSLGQKSAGDCSVDLKLGRLGDFGDGTLDRWKDTRAPAAVSPSGSSKRARGTSNGNQTVSCLVDGCKSDLSMCREYHRRHKVCEVHAKTPIVIVGGRQQRFCQQCSRFHSLEEFDEVKRSCRKRLDGHNRRRRKPQPDSISTNPAALFTNHQGSRFSSYQQILSTTLSEPTWPATIKTEEDALYARHTPLHFLDRQNHFPVSFSRNYKAGKSFGFSGNPLEAAPACQPLLNTITTSNNDCALSLLSSPDQTSALGLAHIVQADRIPMAQPLIPSIQFSNNSNQSLGRYTCSQASNNVSSTGFSCSAMDEEQVGTTTLVSDGGDAHLHSEQIFQVGGEVGPGNGASSTLPIFWHG
ncbi:hypothetical protein H6P81_012064 [Aristolochia fimbriata]|uniref:SBP-type domain-containing protein n=1 Tax=Aristolochia fimbriata TaxID=158543 RepID=A0AAV7EDV4_ARIFI|nr:hypothetical protein H6P81_012064 [Aristolochia fimbriata]